MIAFQVLQLQASSSAVYASVKEVQKGPEKLNQNRLRLKLSQEEYELLRHRVLERDGWRCQICGSSADLQVHHQQFRSKFGNDELNNLISLCARCHRSQHGHEQ